MKIALCFYGKFTGKNNRGEIQGFDVPFDYLKKNVITENTDIFFHGWDDDPQDSERLINMINPKKYILEKQISFDHPYKHYNFVPDGPWNTKDYLNNNYSRFYSLKKVMELVDDSYDMVLISRFDNVFYEKINFTLLNPENFYVSHWNHLDEGWGFNDGWFISGYENMKGIGLIYDRLDNYFNLESGYFNFIKNHGMNETNITSCHIIWKYRTEELELKDKLYAYGLEYETWGLLRRLDERHNPWGRPDVDVKIPTKI
jgi:hypothetical protein